LHAAPSLIVPLVPLLSMGKGAVIASKALHDAKVQAIYAIAGICLFLRAVEADQHAGPHMPASERIGLVINQMLPEGQWRAAASDIAELYSTVFRDMLDVAFAAKAQA
jgi:hypothetical protein